MRPRAIFVGLLGTLVFGASASGALAAPKLWLIKPFPATRAVVGEGAVNSFVFSPTPEIQCVSVADGELLSNGKPADGLSFSPPSSGRCEETATNQNPGYLLRGSVSHIVLQSNGTAQLTAMPKMILGEPGWCVYELRKFEGVFSLTFSPRALIVGRATASLSKRFTLAAGCAETQSFEFRDEVKDSSNESVYGLELVG